MASVLKLEQIQYLRNQLGLLNSLLMKHHGSDIVEESMEVVAEEVNYELVTDAGRLQNGATVYITNCIACHGANGEGSIGPNMTDSYWINGDG